MYENEQNIVNEEGNGNFEGKYLKYFKNYPLRRDEIEEIPNQIRIGEDEIGWFLPLYKSYKNGEKLFEQELVIQYTCNQYKQLYNCKLVDSDKIQVDIYETTKNIQERFFSLILHLHKISDDIQVEYEIYEMECRDRFIREPIFKIVEAIVMRVASTYILLSRHENELQVVTRKIKSKFQKKKITQKTWLTKLVKGFMPEEAFFCGLPIPLTKPEGYKEKLKGEFRVNVLGSNVMNMLVEQNSQVLADLSKFFEEKKDLSPIGYRNWRGENERKYPTVIDYKYKDDDKDVSIQFQVKRSDICSCIYQVDYYENEKLSYCFLINNNNPLKCGSELFFNSTTAAIPNKEKGEEILTQFQSVMTYMRSWSWEDSTDVNETTVAVVDVFGKKAV